MNLIEEAAKRLEQLQRAGVDVTDWQARDHEPSLSIPPQLERQPASGDVAEDRAIQSREVHVDLAALAAAGFITPDAPRSRIADEFRVLKRPLITNAVAKGAHAIKNGNLIMVTSALPKEGKSFTAVNLALSIAMELDHRVLLVDADVARPSLPGIMHLEPCKGLLDVLVDPSVSLGDVLLRTNIEKLTLLQSGTSHHRATELLASAAMNRLLDDMSSRYPDRIIIFDSPPLLVTTESRELAAHMGQVVVVVEAQHTGQAALTQALAAIETCPIKLLMLNKGRRAAESGGYGYGYGYNSYRYGYGQ